MPCLTKLIIPSSKPVSCGHSDALSLGFPPISLAALFQSLSLTPPHLQLPSVRPPIYQHMLPGGQSRSIPSVCLQPRLLLQLQTYASNCLQSLLKNPIGVWIFSAKPSIATVFPISINDNCSLVLVESKILEAILDSPAKIPNPPHLPMSSLLA